MSIVYIQLYLSKQNLNILNTCLCNWFRFAGHPKVVLSYLLFFLKDLFLFIGTKNFIDTKKKYVVPSL